MSSSKYEIKKIIEKYYEWTNLVYNRHIKIEKYNDTIFIEYEDNRLSTISVIFNNKLYSYLPDSHERRRWGVLIILEDKPYWKIADQEICEYLDRKYKLYIDLMRL